jgi:hypothetical protein
LLVVAAFSTAAEQHLERGREAVILRGIGEAAGVFFMGVKKFRVSY